jgi:hypothetical protein
VIIAIYGQAFPEVSEIGRIVEDIGSTVLVLPGIGEGHSDVIERHLTTFTEEVCGYRAL